MIDLTKEMASIWSAFILSPRVSCEMIPYGGHWLVITGTELRVGLICNQYPNKILGAYLRINETDFQVKNEDAEIFRQEFLDKWQATKVINPETIQQYL